MVHCGNALGHLQLCSRGPNSIYKIRQDSTSFAAGSNKNHASVGSEAIKAYLLDLCWKPLIDLPSFGLLFVSANFALTSQH